MSIKNLLVMALVSVSCISHKAMACTESSRSSPEIEIEVEFEDYNDVLDRVIYKIEVEAQVMAPTQAAVCQCGLNIGSSVVEVPDSFNVLNAIVGVSKDDGDDFDLEAFEGFHDDDDVEASLSNLPGFRDGGTSFGFSANVDAFDLPPLQAEDSYFLGFLIEFDPDDFSAVNGNLIQFAAGSNEPGHPLNIFKNYQANLRLPPFQLYECDFNLDQSCDVGDLDSLYSLGRLDLGFERIDATEKFDLNGDDQISLADLNEWLDAAADLHGRSSPYVFGDANLDGFFGSGDLVEVFMAGQYETGRRGQTWSTGDWNGDELFDSSDLIRAFQTGAYERGNVATVPEPTSALMLLAALMCGAGILPANANPTKSKGTEKNGETVSLCDFRNVSIALRHNGRTTRSSPLATQLSRRRRTTCRTVPRPLLDTVD